MAYTQENNNVGFELSRSLHQNLIKFDRFFVSVHIASAPALLNLILNDATTDYENIDICPFSGIREFPLTSQ